MSATVNEMASDRTAREVWAALPIREAYPVGSKWTHTSYGTDVFEVVGYEDDGMHLRIRGTDGIVNSWIRSALDSFGDPVGHWATTTTTLPLTLVTVTSDYRDWPGGFPTELRDGVWYSYVNPEAETYARLIIGPDDPRYSQISDRFYAGSKDADFGPLHRGWNLPVRYVSPVEPVAAPVEPASTPEASEPTPAPFEPVRGDRVRVTELPAAAIRYGVTDDMLGMAGTYQEIDRYDTERRHLVILDEGARVWVKSVGRYIPQSPEEFEAALQAAKEAGKVEGKREGRQEANSTFEEWKRTANEVAITYANNNSLCSEFDRCMIEIGLEPRDTYTREWSVEATYSFYVEARTEEEAQEVARERISDGYESGSFEIEEN